MQIGKVDWTYEDIRKSLPEFLALYNERPINYNNGGMLSPHMLATWFITKQVSPDFIIESGIFKGQSTWLFEQAQPAAELHCIDIKLNQRVYISNKAVYYNKDFSRTNWNIPPEDTLCFFDDHQNAFNRIKQCKSSGFKKLIFEDNYPPRQGNCYSIKQALTLGGEPRDYLESVIKIYYEFPPPFAASQTRWGTPWEDSGPATPLYINNKISDSILNTEAKSYTYLCYVEL